MKKGKLYLIPSFLAETEPGRVFPDYNLKVISTLDEFIVEELRTARRFLRKVGYDKDFQNVLFHLLNEHTEFAEMESFLKNAISGKDIGLLSEAGTPCIADPGADIVKLAHRLEIKVVPLTGPSSILLALMSSGFNGQNFVFHGYLPVDKRERISSIKKLESNASKFDQTQIFIETPYRNNQMLTSIIENCQPETLLCVASDISSENEQIISMTIKAWKNKVPDLHKKPAVFLIYR